ncbi:MAG: rRNA adenine N-6-methyltransferase family protein [Patescibacteria group bacterium]
MNKIKIDLNFIKTAIKDFKVGALTPSSKYVVKKILKEIKPEYKYIVEYGPGDGIITKEILKILPQDGRLIAIELNLNFINELKKIKDKRLKIIHGDAVKISKNIDKLGLPRIDAIISGIPCSILKLKDKKELIKNTYDILTKSGLFIIYQNIPLIFSELNKVFKKSISWHFEPRNFVPYFIMVAEK